MSEKTSRFVWRVFISCKVSSAVVATEEEEEEGATAAIVFSIATIASNSFCLSEASVASGIDCVFALSFGSKNPEVDVS